MKTILTFIYFVQLASSGYTNDPEPFLVKKSVLQKKATMLVPQEFVLMDENAIAKKYPSVGHQPSEVYTNKGGTINIALNHTKNPAKESDLEGVKKVMDAQFNVPSIDFIRSEIKVMHGKKFIVMEFVSQAADTKIYNLMAITSLEGRLAMITFNCTDNYRKDWVPTGKKIIESIQVLP
jgi:hypothetical protein